MKTWIIAFALTSTACQFATEKALETATGGKLKVDGDKVTITGENGEKAVLDGQKAVVTSADGGVTTIETDKNGKMEVNGPDGTKAVFGTQELPKGFPLTLVSGATVQTSATTNTPNDGELFMVTAMVKSEVAALSETYEKELKSKGLTVTRSETAIGEGKMVILAGKADKIEAVVQITKTTAAEDALLNLTWKTKK